MPAAWVVLAGLNQDLMQPLPMGTITVTAPAKANLHLEVLGLRDDGFHELAMVMQSIDLADRLRFQNTADADQPVLRREHLSIGDDNLVLRAALLLKERSVSMAGASIHLEKNIPIGAGLAGGSSDGAAALVGLKTLGTGAQPCRTGGAGGEVGSDVPSASAVAVSSASAVGRCWRPCLP